MVEQITAYDYFRSRLFIEYHKLDNLETQRFLQEQAVTELEKEASEILTEEELMKIYDEYKDRKDKTGEV